MAHALSGQVPPRPRTPTECERCNRNEPKRFCRWCRRHVCTEQCWLGDEPVQRRCWDCLGEGEPPEVADGAARRSADGAFAIGALMLCYLIPPVSEWGETTVYHHRACFGVKNRRYTRLRKAFTAWRQAGPWR